MYLQLHYDYNSYSTSFKLLISKLASHSTQCKNVLCAKNADSYFIRQRGKKWEWWYISRYHVLKSTSCDQNINAIWPAKHFSGNILIISVEGTFFITKRVMVHLVFNMSDSNEMLLSHRLYLFCSWTVWVMKLIRRTVVMRCSVKWATAFSLFETVINKVAFCRYLLY